jgi:uncharacterized lipoprotein
MKFRAWWALGAAVLLALSGCHTFHHMLRSSSCNKPQAYMSARSIPPLKIPVGLDAPDTSHSLDIPKIKGPVPPPPGPRDPCLDAPPSYQVPHAPGVPPA